MEMQIKIDDKEISNKIKSIIENKKIGETITEQIGLIMKNKIKYYVAKYIQSELYLIAEMYAKDHMRERLY